MIKIRDLSDVSVSCVIDAFEAAFGDYAVSFERAQIESMLVRRGYTPHLSFGAFDTDAGGRIAAFILNGTGLYRGVSTCYDCGTGALPEYRGCGLAGTLFRHSLPLLRKAGMKCYVLEVLKDNAPAIALYRGNGFEISADYGCYSAPLGAIRAGKVLPPDVTLRSVDAEKIGEMEAFCDFVPSWQNSPLSIVRGQAGLHLCGAFVGDACVGYCVSDPSTGDLTQIAVAPSERRRGIATALLAEAMAHVTSGRIKVLNVDMTCASLPAFLTAAGIMPGLPQHAMSLDL